MPDTTTDQAVVLGGSMAGLLAARVLSERFKRVVVIERDALPPVGEHRRGVPHGRHLHALHPRGLEILNELFPGFSTSLAADGAVVCDILGEARWQLSGSRLRQPRTGLDALFCSRPFIEGHIRAMVQRLPEVRFLEESSIGGLAVTADKRVVTGVQVSGSGGLSSQITAGLVVDATGRGSRMPTWLTELGYRVPAEERVEIGLGYATRIYRLRPGALGSDQGILTAGTPANSRAGVLAVIEGGRHILTVAGICGDFPPTDPEGFDEFVAGLPTADIATAVAGAEPLSDPVPFRFPASVRRRYKKGAELPSKEKDVLLGLTKSRLSLYEYRGRGGLFSRPGKGQVRVRDAITNEVFNVTERRQMHGLEVGDLFEARLVPVTRNYHFSTSFTYHPREMNRVIRREIKRRKKQAAMDAREFCWELERMALQHEHFKNVSIDAIYNFETPFLSKRARQPEAQEGEERASPATGGGRRPEHG